MLLCEKARGLLSRPSARKFVFVTGLFLLRFTVCHPPMHEASGLEGLDARVEVESAACVWNMIVGHNLHVPLLFWLGSGCSFVFLDSPLPQGTGHGIVGGFGAFSG